MNIQLFYKCAHINIHLYLYLHSFLEHLFWHRYVLCEL